MVPPNPWGGHNFYPMVPPNLWGGHILISEAAPLHPRIPETQEKRLDPNKNQAKTTNFPPTRMFIETQWFCLSHVPKVIAVTGSDMCGLDDITSYTLPSPKPSWSSSLPSSPSTPISSWFNIIIPVLRHASVCKPHNVPWTPVQASRAACRAWPSGHGHDDDDGDANDDYDDGADNHYNSGGWFRTSHGCRFLLQHLWWQARSHGDYHQTI